MRTTSDQDVTERPQRYWAFCAKPTNYRIEDAVRELVDDSWNVPRGDVLKGDRGLVWKAQDRRNTQRGIVALFEVLTDPYIGLDPYKSYWVDADQRTEVPIRRVDIHYVVPPTLPLWLAGPHHDILSDLTVSRGQGTVFYVTATQWEALMAAIGGWPQEAPEIADAKRAVEALSGKGRTGQGFLADSRKRQAVEHHAMALAMEHYVQTGWHVTNVSGSQSYDLLCTRNGIELHVEVKGSTADGSQVLLTRNEVEHARSYRAIMALCVVVNICISFDPDGALEPSDGDLHIIEPWDIDAGVLSPLAYEYTVPLVR